MHKTQVWRSVLPSYLMTILLVATAFLLTASLQAFEVRRPSLFLLFASVVISAWIAGPGAGLCAAILSIAAGFYFYSVNGHMTLSMDQLLMCGFFACCIGAGMFLNIRHRQADHALRQAHRALQHKTGELEKLNASLREEMAERISAESVLAETQSELSRVARLTTMGELAASIAHEINQPLAAIVTNAGSLLRWLDHSPPSLDQARNAARSIIRDGNRASEVVAHTRELVRKRLPKREWVDMNAAIHDVLILLRHELQKREIHIVTDIQAIQPPVYGDRVQLQQVLLNILMNAMEALDEVLGYREIRIASLSDAQSLQVQIDDTGPGLATDVAALFDAFYTTKAGGMGMGLSICRSIIEAHGGSMTASNKSSGASFEISLPLNGDGS